MSDEFAVFDRNGKLQGNLTGNYGQAPGSIFPNFNPLPAISNGFAPVETSQGPVIASAGGTTTGGNVSANGAPSNAIGTPSNAQTTVAGTSIASGSAGDYFLRVVIVVLGFIFVAVGLNMFRPGIVPGLPK